MKKVYLLFLLFFVSCSPDRVAEKALQEIGSGKFAEDVTGISFAKMDMFREKGSIYDRSLVKNYAIKYGDPDRASDYEDAFFQLENLFKEAEFIERKKSSVDLWRYDKRDFYLENGFDAMYHTFFEHAQKVSPDTFEGDSVSYKYLSDPNVPLYTYRYKIDNRHIAELTIIKHPDRGYKVTSFMYTR